MSLSQPEFLHVAAEVAVKSLILPLIVLAVLTLVRRVPAAVRHRVLVMAFVLLAVLPLPAGLQGTLPQSFLSLPSPSLVLPKFLNREDTFKEGALSAPVEFPDASHFLRREEGNAVSMSAQNSIVSLPATVLMLWGGGGILSLWSLFRGLQYARRLTRTGTPAPTLLMEAVSEAAAHLGIAPVATRIVPALVVPVVCGVRRPLLLLPAHASEWDTDRLCSVLLHELTHIARGDFAMQTFARIVTALYFWNPLVWLLFSRLRAEAETACDERVLAAGIPATRYAAHLFAIAREAAVRPAPATLPAMVRASRLESRIRVILTPPAPHPSRRPWLILPVGIATMVALFALRLSAAAEEPRVAIPTDATAFLQWSMSRHAALRTYRSSSWASLKTNHRGHNVQHMYHRTIAYAGARKYLVRYEQVESGHSRLHLTATSSRIRSGLSSPSSSMTMRHGAAGQTFTETPVFTPPTLLHRFFNRPSGWRSIAPSGNVRFAGDMEIRGEKCRAIRFTGPHPLGEVTAAIRLRDGMFVRLLAERWLDYSRGEDRREIDQSIAFARQMLKKATTKRERDYYGKKIAELSKLYRQAPVQFQSAEEVYVIETNKPIPDAALRDSP